MWNKSQKIQGSKIICWDIKKKIKFYC